MADNLPVIRAIGFEGDGSVTMDYLIPSRDAFRTGVVLNHTIHIPLGDQYDEEILNLTEAALALLADVLEDLPVMEPMPAVLTDDEDDDDEDDEG